jgi:CRP/FNR family cyclic AMP-dependent transcriptional regulator
MSALRTSVLDEDRDLADLVGDARQDSARAASTAAVVSVGVAGWDRMEQAPQMHDGYGLLVLSGLLVRRVGFAGRWGAELLGNGDLLRPWEADGDTGGSLPLEAAWRVMAPSRLAVLDLNWAARMSAYPQVGGALAGRALKRSRRLAASLAIVQVPRLDERLWMIFWELADRWGKVHADGVHLELPLTHELLSHLAAARRPSVSGALTRLAESGRVRRVGRAWVLTGDPPDPGSADGERSAVASPG